ncbi:Membrane associated serine protease, rhomboid family [Rhodoblastus acidophilus]|uniref:Membrane associated serine protease, rhomboid family n=1 Tax=Rhodoblastus acidophilus TaxID=1074 RepID=A0A212Q686_RHOAC|nr:rhomboid family intramembrane serine protease [Rhodoblastus acidophilus]MCW2316529.1 membrane associated rhomboid family serine protease [Rhodoblastus acidophilus]PPQ36337.1 rhomboid family intramembrane serine protease [Rhodoblastus acidophilus]RAI19724.1 rhomboid family intramembrane serine protease [Rhodoblastus acidophilus]SNB54868.1 Membrane associated serine protease, rhomboid family [Rhodoblastus acidophilus]
MREKIFNLPGVVTALLLVLTLAHGVRAALPDDVDIQVLATLAFVPGRFGMALDPSGVIAHLNALARVSDDQAQLAQFFLTYAPPSLLWITPVSYAFLHGSWTHLALNGVWLAAFGAPVARRFGSARFLALILLGALAGAAAQFALHPFELNPMVGASAGISACFGAAARFVFLPGAFARDARAADEAPPLAGFGEMIRNRQALAFVGFWFALNLFTGLAGQESGLSDAPIAWEAHIGGFLLGLLAAPLFDRRRKA